jgi:curved DNA-binding protein CbpA
MSCDSIQYDPCNDYYERLGVWPGASGADILRAYRAAVKRHHPDVGGDPSGRDIRAVYEAYGVLGDPVKRSYYNASRHRYGVPRTHPARARSAGLSFTRRAAAVAAALCAAAAITVLSVIAAVVAPPGQARAPDAEPPAPEGAKRAHVSFEYATPLEASNAAESR